MYRDLTKGNITKTIILFALPMIAGNLLQQFYNVADTLIVGQVLGSDALAAVGSAYTLMTFLTSVLLGLSMGAGALFAIYRGKGDNEKLKSAIVHAFLLILIITLILNITVYLFIDPIMGFLNVPEQVYGLMREYLWIIFAGIGATFLYNFFSCLLQSMGNSYLFGNISIFKYWAGFTIGTCHSMGSGRRSHCHCILTVCFRHRYYALCALQTKRAHSLKTGLPLE